MQDWFSRVDDIEVDVFFSVDDIVMIVAKDTDKVEPFASSSFSDRMDQCLIYLDEVHTRRTDLLLAKDARAVVTLGPRLTKDRLVQDIIFFLFRLRCLPWEKRASFVVVLPVPWS